MLIIYFRYLSLDALPNLTVTEWTQVDRRIRLTLTSKKYKINLHKNVETRDVCSIRALQLSEVVSKQFETRKVNNQHCLASWDAFYYASLKKNNSPFTLTYVTSTTSRHTMPVFLHFTSLTYRENTCTLINIVLILLQHLCQLFIAHISQVSWLAC